MTIKLFIMMYTLSGFVAGIIVGAILATVYSYSTGRIAIVKVQK
jgi:hypothetical protein